MQLNILRSTYHQGNLEVYENGGRQCVAMALANIVRSVTISLNSWNRDILDENFRAGDQIYSEIAATTRETANENIPETGYLQIRNLNVIKRRFSMYGRTYKMEYDEDGIFGNVIDTYNRDFEGAHSLYQGFQTLFGVHNTAILIACSKAYGILRSSGKFYFTDSHQCDEKGVPSFLNGTGCVLECNSIEDLCSLAKRTIGEINTAYNLYFIDVSENNNSFGMVPTTQHPPPQIPPIPQPQNIHRRLNQLVTGKSVYLYTYK